MTWVGTVQARAARADEDGDPTTSKLGGRVALPSRVAASLWLAASALRVCAPGCDASAAALPVRCGVCGGAMVLVLQAWTPLEDRSRWLLLLACASPPVGSECRLKDAGWTALRVQEMNGDSGTPQRAAGDVAGADVPALAAAGASVHTFTVDAGAGGSASDPSDGDDSLDALLAARDQALAAKSSYGSRRLMLALLTVRLRLRRRNPESNNSSSYREAGASPGVVGKVPAGTRNSRLNVIPWRHPAVPARMLGLSRAGLFIDEEPSALEAADEHIDALVREYEGRCGDDAARASSSAAASSDAGVEWAEEQFEESDAVSSFLERVARCPEQRMRYAFDGRPLLATPLGAASVPKSCAACGGRMCFELQLLPQAFDSLARTPSSVESGSVAAFDDVPIVCVFVCADSCGPSCVAREHVVVQPFE